MVPSPAFYLGWELPAHGQTFGEEDMDRPRCRARWLRDAPQHPGPSPDPAAGSRPRSLAPSAAPETTAPETAFKAVQPCWQSAWGSTKPLAALSQPPGSCAPREPGLGPLCRATGLRLPGFTRRRVAPAQGIQPRTRGAERIPWAR